MKNIRQLLETIDKEKLDEASMNISMSGDSAAEVGDLLKMLKDAGMPDAAPVSQDHMPPMNPHDDMKSMMMKMDPPEASPCGMGEDDDVEEGEYSNSPEETYGTTDQQMIDLSRDSGVNAPKKMSKKPSWHSGDNPMAAESIKERLMQALAEKKDGICNECGNPSWRTLPEEKQKGVDGKVCWKGYKRMGTKKKGGKTVDNCVKM